MNANQVFTILQTHVPATSLEYCFTLWKTSPFELKVTRSRQTKVGDFTSRHTRRHPRITLNNDLNPYLFLVTYVHEVAHLHVYLQFGNRVDPHGEKWRSTFTDLMLPILWESVFPEEILHQLRRHMINPKASSFADTELTQVPEGSMFRLQGRYYKRGKIRRTRILCRELQSKRDYLVPADALVSDVQLSLL
jgi:SprT protein